MKLNKLEGGYVVLITVLVLGIVVTTVATFLLLTGTNSSLASFSVRSSVSAKAGATGCAQLALGAIQSNPVAPSPLTLTSTLNPTISETCSYTISGSSPNFTITTSGTVTAGASTYVHRLIIVTNQVTPQIAITSWQDTP
jgi:hypothetical protein